ncbi:hypothetical protein [Leifsonia sp. Leaf264]|uniref:hypothetical protein n=1 Tax=Leifsonia sp. Leaf264 TaxID=1736314 RepID=UPI0006F4A36E|nr:hypothetical protein [Leifsonia sp. Leaf264]KQO98576.1 hypothetical protein ASF30_10975 [Leifsonia sp. Leaf264]
MNADRRRAKLTTEAYNEVTDSDFTPESMQAAVEKLYDAAYAAGRRATLKEVRDEIRTIPCWIAPTGANGFDVDGNERQIVLDYLDEAITPGSVASKVPARRKPVRIPAASPVEAPKPAEDQGRTKVLRRPPMWGLTLIDPSGKYGQHNAFVEFGETAEEAMASAIGRYRPAGGGHAAADPANPPYLMSPAIDR